MSSNGDDINFADRLMTVLGGRYDPLMRRSVQSAILFQASSDVEKQFSNLKIFQRKYLLFQAAQKITDSLTDIPLEHRSKLMVRTCTGAVRLSPELAWRRLMFTKRENEKIIIQVKPFVCASKNHEQVCDEFVQCEFEKKISSSSETDQKGLEHPFNWEFSHLKEFIIYRFFYDGLILRNFISPAIELLNAEDHITTIMPPTTSLEISPTVSREVSHLRQSQKGYERREREGNQLLNRSQGQNEFVSTNGRLALNQKLSSEDRISTLQEVRHYLDILKEFEGVISSEELKRKKRDLFYFLPAVPQYSPLGTDVDTSNSSMEAHDDLADAPVSKSVDQSVTSENTKNKRRKLENADADADADTDVDADANLSTDQADDNVVVFAT